MALNIKSPEADRLARELAERTGESITEAVTKAIEERLARCRSEARPKRAAVLRAIRERAARLPTRDPSADDVLVDYDDDGLFR